MWDKVVELAGPVGAVLTALAAIAVGLIGKGPLVRRSKKIHAFAELHAALPEGPGRTKLQEAIDDQAESLAKQIRSEDSPERAFRIVGSWTILFALAVFVEMTLFKFDLTVLDSKPRTVREYAFWGTYLLACFMLFVLFVASAIYLVDLIRKYGPPVVAGINRGSRYVLAAAASAWSTLRRDRSASGRDSGRGSG